MRDIYASSITDAVKKLEIHRLRGPGRRNDPAAIVVDDCHGGDLYQDGMNQYAKE